GLSTLPSGGGPAGQTPPGMEGTAGQTTPNVGERTGQTPTSIGGTGGTVDLVVGGDRALAFASASADGSRLAFASGSFTNACALYPCRADGSDERRLTELNAAVLAQLPIQQPEHFRFPSYDGGFEVDAWLYRPVGYEAGTRFPLVQLIHGGPHSVF